MGRILIRAMLIKINIPIVLNNKNSFFYEVNTTHNASKAIYPNV